MIVIETHRLLIRELRPADAARMFEIYSDPQVMRFMGPPPASVEVEEKSILSHVENYYRKLGYGLWAVIEKGTGELIGRSGLLQFELQSEPPVEISYLLSRVHWGHGYATEAAAAVAQYAFETVGVDRLLAVIAPGNVSSARVAERVGFQRRGVVTYKQFGVVDLYEGTRGRMIAASGRRGQ